MAKKSLFFKREVEKIEDLRETLKALEKISSANLHFWQKRQKIMKKYQEKLELILSKFGKFEFFSSLFKENKVQKQLKVILSVEGKFCGKILNSLLDLVEMNLRKEDEILVRGERGKKLLEERKIKIDYFFKAKREIPTEEDIREMKNFIISEFLNKKWKRVIVFYIGFESFAIQKPKIFEFLPFNFEILKKKAEKEEALGFPIFEPSRKRILNFLIKEYLEFILYEKILETKLSELVTRSLTLEEASDKAKKLIYQTYLQFLRTKRDQITRQVTELFSHKVLIKR
jgi:ATP synthase F1 gamma subunit